MGAVVSIHLESSRNNFIFRWQKLDYDFKYHSLEYETDVPVLVLSEGRSLLPSDFQLKVNVLFCFV